MQEEASKFAAFVGIDWADRKHDVCLQIPGHATPEASVLEHRPTAIDPWARHLRERFGGRPIAVCVELAHPKARRSVIDDGIPIGGVTIYSVAAGGRSDRAG